jgi:hypothetical protein
VRGVGRAHGTVVCEPTGAGLDLAVSPRTRDLWKRVSFKILPGKGKEGAHLVRAGDVGAYVALGTGEDGVDTSSAWEASAYEVAETDLGRRTRIQRVLDVGAFPIRFTLLQHRTRDPAGLTRLFARRAVVLLEEGGFGQVPDGKGRRGNKVEQVGVAVFRVDGARGGEEVV